MTIVNGKRALINKIVFELRYAYGYLYLDRCGLLLNTLQSQFPDWTVSNQVSPQGAALANVRTRSVLNVSPSKYDFSLEQRYGEPPLNEDAVQRFAHEASDVSHTINGILELQEFLRIGFRTWFLFASEDSDTSTRWLMDLRLWQLDHGRLGVLGDNMEQVGFSTQLRGGDRSFIVNFSNVEAPARFDVGGSGSVNVKPRELPQGQRNAMLALERQKRRTENNPRYASMIDIDVFLSHPPIVDPKHFVLSSYEQVTRALATFGNGK